MLTFFTKAKTRAIPCAVIRMQFFGREEIADQLEPTQAFNVFSRFLAFISAKASASHGLISAWDPGDLIIAFPEDTVPSCRLAACRLALEVAAAFPKLFEAAIETPPPAIAVSLAIGIDYGSVVFAPAADSAAAGMVVARAAGFMRMAQEQKLSVVASAAAVAGLGDEVVRIQLADAKFGNAFEVKRRGTVG